MTFLTNNNIFNNTTIGSVSVGNTSTEIVPANIARKHCSLTNKDSKDVWINYGAPAVFGQGELIGKHGGSRQLTSTDLTTLAINGITDSGTNNIAFLEGDVV